LTNGFEILLEPVVPRHDHDLSRRARRRYPERITLALHDKSRRAHSIELIQAALLRLACAPRWFERKGKAEHAHGARLLGCAAGNSTAHRTAASNERQTGQSTGRQFLDDRDPRCVEHRRARWRASAGDTIGLLDQRNCDLDREGRLCRRREVWGADATTGTVTEHESTTRLVDGAHIGASEAVGGLDLDGQKQTAFISSERLGQDRRA
jgi:hypothetical protein